MRLWKFGTCSTSLGIPGSRIVLSPEPEIMCRPWGEQTTEPTYEICPTRGLPGNAPVSAPQIRNVLSQDPETMYVPSNGSLMLGIGNFR